MSQSSVYGSCYGAMCRVMDHIKAQIEVRGDAFQQTRGEKLYEHLTCRIKSEESMREKLRRLDLEEDTEAII